MHGSGHATVMRRSFFAFLVLLSLGIAAAGLAVCIPTVYTVTSSAPPPSFNWTDTSGAWTPSGGFPGCSPGDTAADVNPSPTTIIVNSPIPNAIVGLNLNCPGCVIDLQPGGSLTLAGSGSIGSGASVAVNGGTLTIASAGALTFNSGSTLQVNSGTVDIQTGGQITAGGTSTIAGGALQISGGTLDVPAAQTVDVQSGAQLLLTTGSVTGSGTIANAGSLQANGSGTFPVGAALNNLPGGTVNVTSGTLAVGGGGSGDGPFTIDAGAILDFPASTYTMTPNGVVSGSGTLSVSGGTLSIGGVTSPGAFAMSAGTLTGAGFLSVTSSMDWSGGTITGSGGAELAGTASATFSGADGLMILDGRTFNVYGHAYYSADTNFLQLANGATLAVYGTFELTGDGSILSTGSPLFAVEPNGFVFKTGGTGTSTIDAPTANDATVDAFTGVLELAGDGTHNGSFYSSSGATIAFSASSTTLTGSSSIFSDGTIHFASGITSMSGYYSVNGTTLIDGGAVLAFSGSNGTTESFVLDDGTLDLGSDFHLLDTGTWSGGTINGTGGGTFYVDSGATLTIDAATATAVINGGTLSNQGTTDYTADASGSNDLELGNGAIIQNDGTFDIRTDAPIVVGSILVEARTPSSQLVAGTPAFENSSTGTLKKSAGTGSTTFEPILNNDGTVLAQSGTISFTDQYNQTGGATSLAGGDLELTSSTLMLSGGVLDGAGTITGDVQNDADVAPGGTSSIGTIDITGNYTQGAGGTLSIELDTASTDLLGVSGTATLDGTLDVSFLPSASPANGTTWDPLTFATRSGDFATKNLPSDPVTVTSSYTPTALQLTAAVVTDLSIDVSGPATVDAGASLSYTAAVTNNGANTTSGTTTVANTLPAGVTGASGSGTGWSCGAPAGGVITCTSTSSIASGGSYPALTFSMTAPADGASISDSATVSSPNDANGGNDSDSVSTTVTPVTDLEVTKSGPGGVTSGQNVVYTIVVQNNGPSQATGVVVSDPTPANLSFVSNSGACTTAYPCALGTLNSGQSVTITSTYSTSATFSGNVTNTATVSGAQFDSDNGNDSASVTTNVGAQADLSISKNGPASATAGSNVVYTIVVTNNGPSPAASVVVSDPTPVGIAFVSNSGACATTFPCSLGTLNSGQSATITSTYTIPLSYTGASVVNTATVSSSTNDPNGGDNSSMATTTVAQPADLSITKSGPPSVTTGSNVVYTIVVTNDGPGTAGGVEVADATPAGLTFVSNAGDCTTAFPCTLGTLTNGQTATITSTFFVPPAYAPPSVSNTASVSGSTTDDNSGNDSDTAITPIATTSTSADLRVTKFGPSHAAVGDTVTFTIAVRNAGPDVATSVVVSDPTPHGLQFVSNSGGCTTAFPCTIASLGVDEQTSISATYQVVESRERITNRATASSAAGDPVPANNSDTAELDTLTCPSAAPQLLSPENGSTVAGEVAFSWNAVPNATSYVLTITGDGDPITVTTTDTSASVALPGGTYQWTVAADGGGSCAPVVSEAKSFTVCDTAPAPLAGVIGETTTGQTFTVQWDDTGAPSYELQESRDATFSGFETFDVAQTSLTFTKRVDTATPFFYRVRTVSPCGARSEIFSPIVRVVVVPVPTPDNPAPSVNVPLGSTTPVTFQVFVPGLGDVTTPFVASVDKPWLAVTPTSGVVPPEGIFLTIAVDPSGLPAGTWTGTLIIVYGSTGVSSRIRTNGTTTISIPISVSLVTAVRPGSLVQPADSALVVPTLGHLDGIDSAWRSDLRIANLGATAQAYRLSFSSVANGQYPIKSTVITTASGATTAFDDIVHTLFGIGSAGDAANGSLVIEPLDAQGNVIRDPAASKTSVVSSRTYNASATGTLGQFIPATPFLNFLRAHSGVVLSLQQIAQTSAFRTNLGLVEAAGKDVTANVRVFDGAGAALLSLPVALHAGQQLQLNSFLAQHAISLPNGRIEVEAGDGDGRVTAYASVIDGQSTDPLLVSGVPLTGLGATRFVVPGVADLNTDAASWRSDLRVFNSGAAPQSATFTFFPMANAGPSTSKEVTLDPGQVVAFDDILATLFGITNSGGTLHVTVPSDAPLVVTGRTYDVTPHGTFGQFIPAVTEADAVGAGERALQLVQTESSVRYRTNVGLVEVSGKPVTVEVSVHLPDSKVSPTVLVPLAAFESRQFPLLSSLGLGAVYNARISLRVVDGEGRLTAYASVVDNETQDATYVPAQ